MYEEPRDEAKCRPFEEAEDAKELHEEHEPLFSKRSSNPVSKENSRQVSVPLNGHAQASLSTDNWMVEGHSTLTTSPTKYLGVPGSETTPRRGNHRKIESLFTGGEG